MKEFCVDLKLAKELKDNGFPQCKTNFCYIECKRTKGDFDFMPTLQACSLPMAWDFDNKINTPTSDELLKELPESIVDGLFELYINKFCNSYFVEYTDFDRSSNNTVLVFEEIKLSNALAKMWIRLKEEGYIK